MPQLSQSGRKVHLVAISQGNVYTRLPGDTSWSTPTNNTGDTPPLVFTGPVASAANVEKLWLADGTNWVYFDPRQGTVERWSPTAGELPVDSIGNTPRLICTWRGRTVLSGLELDPQNWFMSRVNDPTDFDYAPTDPDPTQAIAGNNAPQGLVGDVVTALIPYSDDVMICGGDGSVYAMSGDPMAGGQIDRVSDAIGIAWDRAWCKDPFGTLYFVSNRTGIYSWRPGELPLRISRGVEQILSGIDTGESVIRAGYDDRFQCVHFFFTYAFFPRATTHLVYELRTGAWWMEEFANVQHNPIACCTFDGNEEADRVFLIGSWDGYVRAFSPTATTDDGTPIQSRVLYGPLVTKTLDEVILKEMQPVFGSGSGDVNYSVLSGRTAEEALAATAVRSGVFVAGRNTTKPVRSAAHAHYIELSSEERWAAEQMRLVVGTRGKVRRRGH